MKIGFEIKTISRLFKKKIDETPIFRENADLTGIQGWILRYLYERELAGEEVFQRDVERMFQVRRSTATELLNTMEQNGFLERKAVERDARLKRLVLTERGKRLQEDVMAAFDSVERKLTEGFTAEEKRTLEELLSQLRKNLE